MSSLSCLCFVVTSEHNPKTHTGNSSKTKTSTIKDAEIESENKTTAKKGSSKNDNKKPAYR